MKQVLTLLLLIAFTITACKKNPGNDPVITPVKNIMRCKVNGVEHTYKGIPTYLNHEGVTYAKYENGDASEHSLYIYGDNTLDYRDNISIEIFEWNIELNKKYFISNENRKDYGKYVYDNGQTFKTYKTTLNSGYITYTQYSDALIEGNFSFTAYTLDSQRVEITDGYFNIERSK